MPSQSTVPAVDWVEPVPLGEDSSTKGEDRPRQWLGRMGSFGSVVSEYLIPAPPSLGGC